MNDSSDMAEDSGSAKGDEGITAAKPAAFSSHAIHLVRTLTQSNLALSQMADQKASILMGATFLVFTLAVGQARAGPMPWSLMVLALFAFLSALCAVFAVLPSIKSANPATAPNRLFFGVFTQLDEAAWTDEILAELRSDETVFRTMLHDSYQNGMVLQHKKYRYLTLAYKLFIAGLVLTMIVFSAEMAGRPGAG